MNPKPGGRKKPERADAAGDVEKLWLVLRKRLILPGEAAVGGQSYLSDTC